MLNKDASSKVALACKSRPYYLKKQALKLSKRFGLPLLSEEQASRLTLWLILAEDGLRINYRESRSLITYRPDWKRLDTVSKAGRSKKQPLLKALKLKKTFQGRPVVMDCTAGFGEDSWLMACLGFFVLALEREGAVFAMLEDAWSRAGISCLKTVQRIRPINIDALDVLKFFLHSQKANKRFEVPVFLPRPDIVYLDPMFPQTKKRKSAEKKQMRILGQLLSQEEEQSEEEFLSSALEVAKSKVVVKRKKDSPFLGSGRIKPVNQVPGKGFRYDVYSKPF